MKKSKEEQEKIEKDILREFGTLDINQVLIAGARKDSSSIVSQEVAKLLEERQKRGMETYGKPLSVFNGQDALQDLIEELADGYAYALQIALEEGSPTPTSRRSETVEMLEMVKSTLFWVMARKVEREKRRKVKMPIDLRYREGTLRIFHSWESVHSERKETPIQIDVYSSRNDFPSIGRDILRKCLIADFDRNETIVIKNPNYPEGNKITIKKAKRVDTFFVNYNFCEIACPQLYDIVEKYNERQLLLKGE